MDEVTNTETMSTTEALKYTGARKDKLLSLARAGEIEGAVRGSGFKGVTAAWTFPKASLDVLIESGKLDKRREYTRRAVATNHTGSGQLLLKDAAKRFGIGYSTLQKKVKDGVLPATKANLGPGRTGSFVKPADVEALGIKPGSGRYPRKKKSVADGLLKAGKVSLTPPPTPNLDSELLRMADMVRAGTFRVTRLNVGLEFTGGGNGS